MLTRQWREARAQRILDATATLILRDGYDKSTIEDIASEAGVGKGALYLHFLVHLTAGLIADCHLPKKPSLDLSLPALPA